MKIHLLFVTLVPAADVEKQALKKKKEKKKNPNWPGISNFL